MDFNSLKTYQQPPSRAFEALCNQLFEQWVRASYVTPIKHFTTVNGDGGDGGVEAYAELTNGEIIGLQAKWFLSPLGKTQTNQIWDSVVTARCNRSQLKRYVVCVPRDFNSITTGTGGRTRKSEEQRIQELITKINGAYPDLTVEFWTEHHLRQRLQQPGNEGVMRFWFINEELSPAALELRFKLAKSGWLRERYSPDLHCLGLIQQEVEEALFSSNSRIIANNQVGQVEVEVAEALHLIDLFIARADAPVALVREVEYLKAYLQGYQEQLRQVAQALLNGCDNLELTLIDELDIWSIREKIATGAFSNRVRGIKQQLIDMLEVVQQTDLPTYLFDILQRQLPHNAIVFGRPGTGKTHGVARAVELRLNAGYPALIISARSARAQNWRTILEDALGITGWPEREIFAALEAMAARCDVRRAYEHTPSQLLQNEPTRVLICIDGVDEAPDPVPWRERINELPTWLAECPRLRFIVTSRSYPPNNQNPCGLACDDTINRRLDLPAEGDVPIHELADRYLHHYSIDYSSMPWLPDAFQDALSIRLFAQQRQGQNLASIQEPITVSLSDLLNYKIELIEAEFTNNPQLTFPEELHLARWGLVSLTKQLQVQPAIDHDIACRQLVTDLNERVTLNEATRMLKGYANHGLVVQWQLPATSRLAPKVTRIAFSYQQPLIDYLLAGEATAQIVASGDKNVPDWLLRRSDQNALQLTAVALLNDNRILVGAEGYWTANIAPARLEAIKYYALRVSASEAIRRYLPTAMEQFKVSVRDRNLVLNSFILPNLYRTDVDIALAVHQVLVSFSTVFDRDELWAGPPAHDQSYEQNIGHILIDYQLYDYYPATSLPLIFAWSLATINNTYREYACQELTRWGRTNIPAFVELLDLVFFQGDPQMQEDLASVMLGIMSLVPQPGTDAPYLSNWILSRLFSLTSITQLLNSVVRAYARDAIELAIATGDCSEIDAQVARPPYLTSAALLPLKLATENEKIGIRGERFPIVHDLAWYVLKEAYQGFMDYPTSGKDRSLAQGFSLLAEYEHHYRETLGTSTFAMSAALAYIASLGYNKSSGWDLTSNRAGVSEISTFEEKYTWLAVHHIQGHLADRLPYEAHGTIYQRAPTYRLFLSTANPAAGLDGTADIAPAEWYVPIEISPDLPTGSLAELPERVKAWVNRKEAPDFRTWLTLPDFLPAAGTALRSWLPLYAQVRLPERTNCGVTTLELCCVWVSHKDWAAMHRSFAGNMSKIATHDRWSFCDVDHWQARPNGETASVKDVVRGHHLNEVDSSVTLYASRGREWTCYKTVTSVGERLVGDHEETYLIPSQLVRQHLGIMDTDKQRFTNQAGQIVASYQEINEDDREAAQILLVADRQQFMAASARHELRPFWLISQFQKTTIDFTKQYRDAHVQNIRFWIVW